MGFIAFHAKNSDVSWTVDIPKEALPDLPPLPDGIRQQFEDVISRDAKQQPSWDTLLAQNVRKILESVPPIVVAPEVRELERQLAAVANGEAFLLQGGDCAETFESNTEPHIRANVKTLLQMAVVLTYGASTPVVKLARIAGQYAKPRSSDLETRDGVTLPSYRGDAVNSFEFTPEAREPDPQRLLSLYNHAASTLNLIRAFTKGGYADLRQVHRWNQGFMSNPAYARYESLAADIHRAIKFMGAAGVDFETLRDVDLYSSHEALLLEYESAMTRIDSRTGEPYNTSAHFLWVGERTREEEGAHIELLSRVRNPIGVKLGPSTTRDQMLSLIDRLNPDGEEGRLSFITRMGAERIREVLPPLLEAAREDGRPITWMTDPMHGNTITSSTGYKTRRFETVMDEVRGFFEAHEAADTVPGGLHVELTGDDVTEVIGGSEHIDDESLRDRYETLVDPRLNHQQSLEMAFQVAQYLAKGSSHEE